MNRWEKGRDMPTEKRGLSTSAVNGRIYAIGGSTAADVLLSTVEEYDTGFAGEEEKVVGVEAKGKHVTSWRKMKNR